jgi:hypothetical protein
MERDYDGSETRKQALRANSKSPMRSRNAILMVRSAERRVSNHEARGPSFETAAFAASSG